MSLCLQAQLRWFHAFRLDGDGDVAGGVAGLYGDDEFAVEEAHAWLGEDFERCGVAVADASEGGCSADDDGDGDFT